MDEEKMDKMDEMEGMGGMGMMPGMGMHHMGMMPGMCMPGMKGMGMMGKPMWRKFLTKEEKMAKMDEYLKQLQMEEKGVKEKLDYMKNVK